VAAAIGLIGYGSTLEGGLSDFYTNTSNEYAILTGLGAGFCISFLVAIVISVISKKHLEQQLRQKKGDGHYNDLADMALDYEWQKTMSIDNPLNPYINLYKHKLERIGITSSYVTTDDMVRLFRRAKIISIIMATISFCVFIVVIPAVALSQEVLTEEQMTMWITVIQHYCYVATVLVVVLPPIQEGWQIWRQLKINKQKTLKPQTNGQVMTKF